MLSDSDARHRPSFLTATLILCVISPCNYAFADTFVVDDQDDTPDVLWDGIWVELDGHKLAPAWDGTLTCANTTGPTVTFTFIGISVQVFGAFTPVGTWNMHSLYSIDGGHPTVFIPSPEVGQDAYGQNFFDSGKLPLDRHTLKITNIGDQLWLDYFLYDDGNRSIAPTSDSTDRVGGTKAETTTVTRSRHPSSLSTPLITPSLPSSSSEVSTGGIIPSTSAEITTLSQPNPALPIATPPSPSLVPPTSLTLPQSPLLPPPSTLTLSLNATVPSQAAVNTAGEQHAHGVSRTALIALAAASGTIAAIALLATLPRLRRWYCNSPRRPRGWFRLSFRNTLCRRGRTAIRAPEHESQYLTPPSPVPGVAHPAPVSARAGEGDGSCSCCGWLRGSARRSIDGGVRIAGGPPGMSRADAPSLSDAESEKSTLPPSYKDFDHDNDNSPGLTDGCVVP